MKPQPFFLSLALLAAACGVSAPPATPPQEAAPLTPAAAPVESPTAPAAAPPAPVRVAPQATDEVVNGVRVLHLRGTPEEMGAQMGAACGEALRVLVESNLKRIPWIARDPKAAVEKARRFAKGIPDDQMRELRATAKTAGVDEDWMLVAATVIEVVEDARACAAVAAWGTATPASETIVGRNLDWYDFGKLHQHGLLVVRHPEDARSFVSCGFPGIPGVLTGMNDAGVFVADLVQFAKSPPAAHPDGIPVMSLQRIALEKSASAAEALAAIRGARRTVPQNYIVADASGATFLETDAAEVATRAPRSDTVVGTNWAEEERGTLKGDLRFGNICRTIDANVGALGVPEIEKALGAADTGMSVMSVVALPAKRLLRVSAGKLPACKGPFAEIDAAALFARRER